jgi:hypothetical protein
VTKLKNLQCERSARLSPFYLAGSSRSGSPLRQGIFGAVGSSRAGARTTRSLNRTTARQGSRCRKIERRIVIREVQLS